MMATGIHLRPVEKEDLPHFFRHQQDVTAWTQAAFTSKDPNDQDAFMSHWTKILADNTVHKKTIVFDGLPIGHIASWVQDGKRNITYWIDRGHWGKGLATRALEQFIQETPERPLYASAAKDNLASLRVLAKCGFTVIGQERGYANARCKEIDEVLLELTT